MASTINPNEIIPTLANGMLHDLIWGTKKIVDADEVPLETLFEGEVTTEKAEGDLFAAGDLDVAPSAYFIKVTFNGEVFTVNKQTDDAGDYYGELDNGTPIFNTYPFLIAYAKRGVALVTPEAGTYSLKIEEPGQSGGSSDFSTAEVTINFANAPDASITIASIDEELQEIFVNEYVEDGGELPVTLVVPLYKGKCEIYVSSGIASNQVTVTGSIEYNSPYAVITGNGAIEIAGAPAGAPA